MPEKVEYCPVCLNKESDPFLSVRDYFLSCESFQIRQCSHCGFRFVDPRPDRSEIGSYYQSDEYISHDAEGRNMLSRVYRLARIYSIRRKYSLVYKAAKPRTLLDIGCGTGEFLRYCSRQGIRVTGVEPNEKARQYAVHINGIRMVAGLEELDAGESRYDCITLWHVLEHVHDLDPTLGRIKKLLAPGGILVVAVPNCQSDDARRYGRYWAAYDVPRHLYHFAPATLGKLFHRHGFTILDTRPQLLDAFYISLLSEKYRSGKNRPIAAVLSGLRSNFAARKPGWGHSSVIFILSPKKA